MSGVFAGLGKLTEPLTDDEVRAQMKKAYPLRRFRVFMTPTSYEDVAAVRYNTTESGVLELYTLDKGGTHLEISRVWNANNWVSMKSLGLAEDA